jgi:hypothetical protein
MMIGIKDLDREQRARVGAYWWRRAEGEITSWVAFGHVLEDLRAEGSPSPVVALAERAVRDEYLHAMFCREWAGRFGHAGGELRPRSETPVTFRGATESENRLLRIAFCCLTETVGCFILRHVRPVLRNPELRKLNQRHMTDELVHSRVGWGHLSTLDRSRQDCLRDWMPRLLEVLPVASCDGPEEACEELVPFGYFTPRLLRAAHDEAVREVILPGLEHLGIMRAA